MNADEAHRICAVVDHLVTMLMKMTDYMTSLNVGLILIGCCSGGVTITVSGTGLDVISNPQMIVYLNDSTTVISVGTFLLYSA